MYNKFISTESIESFRAALLKDEKSTATIEKYVRDVGAFKRYADGRKVDKQLVMDYKSHIRDSYFTASSYYTGSLTGRTSGECLIQKIGVVNCIVNQTGGDAGGIAGVVLRTTVVSQNCHSVSTVSGGTYTGGLVGNRSSKLITAFHSFLSKFTIFYQHLVLSTM